VLLEDGELTDRMSPEYARHKPYSLLSDDTDQSCNTHTHNIWYLYYY